MIFFPLAPQRPHDDAPERGSGSRGSKPDVTVTLRQADGDSSGGQPWLLHLRGVFLLTKWMGQVHPLMFYFHKYLPNDLISFK